MFRFPVRRFPIQARRPHHRAWRALLLPAAPAALCLLALTACGGGGGASHPGVASLPATGAATTDGSAGSAGTSGGPAGAPTASGSGSTAGRPQERLDDTPEEREALIHAWDQCLVDHGAHWDTARSGPVGKGKLRSVADPVPAAARAACENKMPQEPTELNPALNPHYRDDMVAEIACLRAHGVMVHLVQDTSVDPDGLSWTYDSSTTKVPGNEGQIENQCQLNAFGGGKGK